MLRGLSVISKNISEALILHDLLFVHAIVVDILKGLHSLHHALEG